MPDAMGRAEPPVTSHEQIVPATSSDRPDLAKQAAEAQLAYEMGHDALAAKREDIALVQFGRACENRDPRGCYNVAALTEPKISESRGPAGPDPVIVAIVASAYSDACDLGFQRGCAMLVPYLRGIEYAFHDSARAITVARAACEAGENFACAELAEISYTGEGMAADLPEAARLFRKLCDAQWQSESCFNYALMLDKGEVSAPDGNGAVHYYRLGCRRGSDAACINLANYYAESPEVPEFRQLAAGLLEQSCERGAIIACSNLATLVHDYRIGSDFKARAASLYRSACERGHGDACRSLGNLAQDGVAGPARPAMPSACL
jgi:TPR repeat protein